MKLNNEKDKENIKEVLRRGMKEDFWDLLRQALTNDAKGIKKDMEEDISELPAEQYKFQKELMIAKIDFIESLKVLPETVIESLTSFEEAQDDFDPYPKEVR